MWVKGLLPSALQEKKDKAFILFKFYSFQIKLNLTTKMTFKMNNSAFSLDIICN